MNYRHRFQVHAPLARVSDFHSQAASMPAITPPPLSVRLYHTPGVLGEGDDAEWVHRHSFNALDNQTTEVVDEITLRPRSYPLWWLVGMGMWTGLPFLLAFRASKTRRMLQ